MPKFNHQPNNNSNRKEFLTSKPFLFLLGLCLVTFLIYFSATGGPVLLDDYPNVVTNEELRIDKLSAAQLVKASDSMNSADSNRPPLTYRPISYLSFSLNYYFSGEFFPSIKSTNIALHLICGVLIYFLFIQLNQLLFDVNRRAQDAEPITPSDDGKPMISIDWKASIAAGFWLVHPLMVSSVLYGVQRMTILSALFSICAIISFIYFRKQLKQTSKGMFAGIASVSSLTLLAILSKENGILTLLVCGLIELCFFRLKFYRGISKAKLVTYLALLVIPFVFILGYLNIVYWGNTDSIFEYRRFDSHTRLLTQFRVMMDYLIWFVIPTEQLLIFHHDYYQISSDILSPISTLISMIFWGVVTIGAFYSVYFKKVIWLGFGILWFLAAHLIESTVINLELVFEHRNYFPYIGLSFSLVWGMFLVFDKLSVKSNLSLILAGILFILLPLFLTNERVGHWQSMPKLIEHWYKNNPGSARAWVTVSSYYLEEKQFSEAVIALHKAHEIAPWEAGYGFAQLGIVCGYSSTFKADEIKELVDKTIGSIKQKPTTAYSQNQLGSLLKLCTDIERITQLKEVYTTIADSPVKAFAAKGIYMLAMIEINRNNRSEAIRLLNLVIERDPGAEEVKKLIETLQ
ncbi:MAG: hypothetical protein OQJ89_15170 [Kangiellaceae bacterium]|nr:hypothetical protein [Kangiellaceae bacterium]MCW9000664.1 hypothetical protein [Kangiellaceae bacterium]MCW9018311.1 hypothetical protein [Kangiellaceae bacterium]